MQQERVDGLGVAWLNRVEGFMKRFLKIILLLSVMVAAFCCRPEICRGQQDAEKAQPAASLEEIRKKAEGGDARSQWLLGSRYQVGEGVEKDAVQAVKWFRMAAEQGEANAQFSMGVMYSGGEGVKKDLAEAAKWYRKAAEQGVAKAQFNLGLLYLNGEGVKKDLAEAAKWYRKAAEQGVAKAQYNLGLMYYKGEGVKKDLAEAAKWVRKAAELGAANAQFFFGGMYLKGKGVPINDEEAAKWYRRAAEQGVAEAQSDLGVMYSEGKGVPKDYVEAYRWANVAAARGNSTAKEFRDWLERQMTREQIAEGQRRAAAFVARPEQVGANAESEKEIGVILEKSRGTGFFVTEDGYVLTNFHVVEDTRRIVVKTKAGSFPAKVVRVDKSNDLALLKVEGKFSALPIVNSREGKLGAMVFTIGFPLTDLQGESPKLSKGEIASLSGMRDDPRHFQISAAVQAGNSGGALVNEFGNVVGVVVAKLDAVKAFKLTGDLPQNVNYAVKSSYILSLLEAVPEVAEKLKQAQPSKARAFEDVVKEAEAAAAMVVGY